MDGVGKSATMKKKIKLYSTVPILFTGFLQVALCVHYYPIHYSPWSLLRDAVPKCPEPKGQFPHPKYCDLFLNCWDNVAFVQECNGGLVFNEKIAACDFPRNVDCKGRGNSQTSQIDARCPDYFGTFPNPQNCSEYIVCYSGVATIKECPENTYYNETLGICTTKKGPSCIDNEMEDLASTPVSAGSPTLKPPPSQLPYEPKPPLYPGPTPSLEPSTSKPQHPLRPKPPLEPEAPNQPQETSTHPTSTQSEEPEITSSRPATVSLKPKPALKPEGTNPEEGQSSIDGVPSEQRPTPSIPPLNPGSFKPGKPPGPANLGPSTTPAPIDGEDDPHILFPFLPAFPELFRCPVPTVILPIVGDCESLIVCLNGVGHYFRCPKGQSYDLKKGSCSLGRHRLCGASEAIIESLHNNQQRYAYLPVSRLQFNNSLNNYF